MAKCSAEDCEASFVAHKWGSIKAHDEGWFLQKDGTVYCPKHTPDWVKEWREKQTKEK